MNFSNLTGVVVSYNTKDLLRQALESIEKHYNFPIIIIDGSEVGTECYDYVKSLPNQKIQFGWNIGHGKGLDIGIMLCNTRYILVFDSDIVMDYPCIEKMLEEFKESTYGVGEINIVKAKTWGLEGDDIRCLHPYFQIIRRKGYYSYLPYVHSGAPTILTTVDLHTRGHSDKLIDFPVKGYVRHLHKGTIKAINKADHYKDQVLVKDYFKQTKEE